MTPALTERAADARPPATVERAVVAEIRRDDSAPSVVDEARLPIESKAAGAPVTAELLAELATKVTGLTVGLTAALAQGLVTSGGNPPAPPRAPQPETPAKTGDGAPGSKASKKRRGKGANHRVAAVAAAVTAPISLAAPGGAAEPRAGDAEIVFQVYDEVPEPLVAAVELETQGFRLLSSLTKGETTCLLTPGRDPRWFPLRRKAGRVYLDCKIVGQGRLEVVGPGRRGPDTVSLMLDTGANVSCCSTRVANGGWLERTAEGGITATAANGGALVPHGTARASLRFTTGSDGTSLQCAQGWAELMVKTLYGSGEPGAPSTLALVSDANAEKQNAWNRTGVAKVALVSSRPSAVGADPLVGADPKTAGSKQGRFAFLTTAKQVAEHVGIRDKPTLRRLHTIAAGVRPLKDRDDDVIIDPGWLRASMTRRAVPSKSVGHHGVTSAAVKRGTRWYIDITKQFTLSVLGNTFAVVAVESTSGYLWAQAIPSKSADDVFGALDSLCRKVPELVPPDDNGAVRLLEVYADSDTVWTATAGGDDRDNAPAREFRRRTGVVIRRSPPHTPERSRIEAHIGVLGHQLLYNMQQAHLSDKLWDLTFEASVHQINARPETRSRDESRQLRTRFELLRQRLPDLSAHIGRVGQGGFLKVFGAGASHGGDKATPCLYFGPKDGDGGGGFVVFDLLTLKRRVAYHLALAPPGYVLATVARSDALFRGGDSLGSNALIRHEAIRGLFAAGPPGIDAARALVVFDPLTSIPMQLFPGVDERGQLVALPGLTADSEDLPTAGANSKGSLGGPRRTGSKPATMPNDAVGSGAVGGRIRSVRWKDIRSLPDTTSISFAPNAKLVGSKCHQRYSRYSTCRTIGELRSVQAPAFFRADALHDYQHGLLIIPALEAAPTTDAVAAVSAPSDAVAATTATGTHPRPDGSGSGEHAYEGRALTDLEQAMLAACPDYAAFQSRADLEEG